MGTTATYSPATRAGVGRASAGRTFAGAALLAVLAACGGSDADPAAGGAAPTVTLTAPAAYASGLTGTFTASAVATAAAGSGADVAAVEFELDGVSLGAADTTAPYTASVDTTPHPAGQHVLRARARDTAGRLSAWASATLSFGGARTHPAGFTRDEAFVTGLTSATAFAQAPDGRIFVAEQGGRLRVVKNGALLATPFVTLAVDSSGERGLIGVAIDPAFASNGFVYLHHTVTAGGAHNRVSRYTANGDVAAAGSERVLVDLPVLSAATNHNGGAIHFGLDGKLYVAVGENATPSRAQDLSDPFGKLLRFEADGAIPSDNPFCSTPATLACAVWAYGLRNPFTFAVQPGSGRIFINDVGAGTWEEINDGTAGANYGWPASEGPDGVAAGITAPLFTYKHGNVAPPGSGPGGFFVGFAIAGGAFYPASGAFPAAYRDQYYFADFASRFVARLDLAPGRERAVYAFATVSDTPVDLLLAGDGALLVLTRGGITRLSAP